MQQKLAGTGAVTFASWTVTTTTTLTGAVSATNASNDIRGIGSFTTAGKAEINAEIVDCLNVDTYAEIGQETPAATNTIRKMLAYLFKAFRNKKLQTASQYSLLNDDAATVDQKATVTSDGTTVTIGEITTGP
jgi:hypothetical protein